METPKSDRSWLLAAPFVLLLALFVVPMLRPLVLSQAMILFNSPSGYTWVLRDQGLSRGIPDGDPETEQAALRKASLRYPLDYPTQLAYAVKADGKQEAGKPDVRVVRLNALTGTFPGRPALYAHILRYATYADVQVRRTNELRVNLYGQKPLEETEGNPDAAPADTPARLAEFEKVAAAGEQLEADNAYFPMMRAIGLFAAHQDEEALAAIRRAGQKSRWDDHIDEEAEADWKLLQEAFGAQSAALRAVLQNSVVNHSIPHFDALKDVGTMTVYHAVQAERAGRTAEGYALRRALARCIGLMRAQSRSIQGARISAGMIQDLILRPGGIAVQEDDVKASTEQRAEARLQIYYDYLKKLGHPEEIPWLQREVEAGKRAQAIQEQSVSASLSPYGHQAQHLDTLWIGDFVLLTNALEAMALIVAGLLLIRLGAAQPPTTLRPRPRHAASFAIALLILFVTFSIVTFQTQWGPAFGSLRVKIAEFMSGSGELSNESRFSLLLDSLTNADAVRVTLMTVSLIGPGLILLGLGLVARMRRELLVLTSVQRMAPVGAIAAFVLLLLYGGLALQTAHAEKQLHSALDRVLVSEGRYDAELTGQTWPP